MPDNKDLKVSIQTALEAFEKKPLAHASVELLNTLGYRSKRVLALKPNTAKQFQVQFDTEGVLINQENAWIQDWTSVDLLFQVTDAEIREAASGNLNMFTSEKVDNQDIRSYLFFAVELKAAKYTRSQLAGITREINKLFRMPVMVIFKYDQAISIAIIARHINKRDGAKDVLEKVTLIKDIRFTGNRAQIEILHDLAISQLTQYHEVSNFVDLQKAWEKTLDTNELNKKFYREIANWYFWAVKTVKFPKDAEKDEATRNATGVIRLITRLIFVWFIKEKGLVPEELFDDRRLKEILNFSDPKKSTYYKAILQNLFFATLNTEMGEGRIFRRENAKGQDPDYLMSNFYRYKRYFKNQEKALELFAGIPFLNGGLFECLDKEVEKGVIIRVDGFSDREDNPLQVPDDLFLMEKEKEIDLNEIYDTRNKKYKVRGLIHILSSYKFTIEENTPIEEEIALDPELLGKVFENLLAAYNPETGTTARKQTGSFYTPREIVNYMVDEALIAYLESSLKDLSGLQDKLHHLLAYNNEAPQFSEAEKEKLIAAIDAIKVLDPAAGSGAFPMGVLHKLVFILSKLDPNNERWKQKQLAKAYEMTSTQAREAAVKSTEDVFSDNHDDYGRKLYLIENCIYGVDIQPIAVQIAKLRFFISLVVDQKTNSKKPNLGIRPLPNLETKFVAANTLIGIQRPEAGTAISFGDILYKSKQDELKKVRQNHFSARTPKSKRDARGKDKELREEISTLLKKDGWGGETAAQLASWDPYDQSQHADFFDPEWMFGIEDGFDVILGNPPYVGQKHSNEIFQVLKKTSIGKRFHQRRMDYFYFFFHAALDYTKNHGTISFITTNYYLTATYADKLRSDIRRRSSLKGLVNFNELKIFESALGQHNMITFLKKGYSPQDIVDCYFVTKTGAATEDTLQKILAHESENVLISHIENKDIYEGESLYIRMTRDLSANSQSGESIFEKMKKDNLFLEAICNLVEGIHTGADKVSDSHLERYDLELARGKGIFVLSKTELLELNLDENERKIIKPWYKNSDIERWITTLSPEKFLIYYTTKGNFKYAKTIRKYLGQFKPILINRKTRSGTGIISTKEYDDFVAGKKYISYVMNASAFKKGEYYCISYPREQEIFENEKIIVPQRSPRNTFAYNAGHWYASADVYFITQKMNEFDLKYILGLLNSKLYFFWLYHKGKRKGEILELYIRPLSEIPIKNISMDEQKPIIELVSKILIAKRDDPQADTSKLEGDIDQLVYQLYGLTADEIKIVKG